MTIWPRCGDSPFVGSRIRNSLRRSRCGSALPLHKYGARPRTVSDSAVAGLCIRLPCAQLRTRRVRRLLSVHGGLAVRMRSTCSGPTANNFEGSTVVLLHLTCAYVCKSTNACVRKGSYSDIFGPDVTTAVAWKRGGERGPSALAGWDSYGSQWQGRSCHRR
jgi:hypothetical protein